MVCCCFHLGLVFFQSCTKLSPSLTYVSLLTVATRKSVNTVGDFFFYSLAVSSLSLQLSHAPTDCVCFMQLNELVLPDHWMKYFFTAQVYLELQLNHDALRCYERLRTSHFACSTYVMSQLALAYHNIRSMYFSVWLTITSAVFISMSGLP